MVKLRVRMTSNGLENLIKELKELNKKLPIVIDRVAKAREQGDLSENSEYTYAREDLEFLENKIAEVEFAIDNAEVVEKNGKNGEVSMGSEVEIELGGSRDKYTLVNELESDPGKGKISDVSPIGMALIGKKVGDEGEIELPNGKVKFRVVKVS